MTKFKRLLTLASAVTALATIGTFMDGNHYAAKAAGAPVTIESPVPLPVTLSGTPAVALAPGAAVSITGNPAVSLSNTSKTPIFVDAETAARAPFVMGCFTTAFSSGATTCNLSPAVPAGERFVIETVSAFLSLPSGVKQTDISLGTPLGETLVRYDTVIPVALQGTGGDIDYFAANQQVRLYTDSILGLNPSVYVVTSSATSGGMVEFTLVGYLVSIP